ncbi:unnamed protein product [Caenorhabditis auriculariae]|uniref:Uncharacterized protein n=1 Tax=Caenorhabditis auriculariae TaxID=2777116 RepID=A0A8S1GWI6_9PELO|nr:unnamed protein product [Caenorhabditis auriculariae]
MTSLYPDESHCTNELGRLLFHPKSDWSAKAEVTSCEEVKQLAGSYTVYTISFEVVPHDCLDQPTRSFSLSTRFKELSKLHAALAKLHKQLYLRGVFPSYPPPKLLGSNEPAVVEERRASTDQFLAFVLDSEVLRKARVFHEFLDKAKECALTVRAASPDAFLYENSSSILDAPISFSQSRSQDSQSPPISPSTGMSQPIDVDQGSFDASSTAAGDFQFPDVAIDQSQACPAKERRKRTMRKLFPRLSSSATSQQLGEDSSTDYLVRAGHLVATAQRAEEEHAYELAFQCYKNAARSLIQGVQLESDMLRRNAVRRKTAKYLVKAEKLYQTYLSYDGSVFNVDSILTSAMQDPNILAFQCANHSLKNYRFLGVLPSLDSSRRVLLVEETSSLKKFVIKLLEKGPHGVGSIFLPTNVPHMVQLVQFFETDQHIVLLLEHTEPGRLWLFLSRYFCEAEKRFLLSLSKPTTEVRSGEVVKSVPAPVRTDEERHDYSYRGRRVLFTVGVDFERVAEMCDENQSTDDPTSSDGILCTMGEDATGRAYAPSGDFYIVGKTSGDSEGVLNVAEESPAAIRLSDASADQNMAIEKSMAKQLALALQDVRYHLSLRRNFWPSKHDLPECLVVHWCAQLVSFFFVLHTEHREFLGDLQPDDLLLDSDGNILVTYRSRWYAKQGQPRLMDGYSAPESFEYGWKVSAENDIWSLGALMFELITGRSLANAAPHGVLSNAELPFPEYSRISFVAKDILSMILTTEIDQRPSLDRIRIHPFFRHIDWSLYDNPSWHFTNSSGSSLDVRFPVDPAPLTPALLFGQEDLDVLGPE